MNKVIIAAAGSGKTTHIVNQAIRNMDKHILITTFTDANTEEIKKKVLSKMWVCSKKCVRQAMVYILIESMR